MAFNTKINLPISTSTALPNVNNKTAEATYVGQLANKINRSNSGQNVFNSTTSGISYKTVDYPSESTIYNRGETGLYNLLIKLYGGDNGFMIMAEDYNVLASSVTTNTTDIATNKVNITKNTNDIATNTTNISKNTNDIGGIKDGSVNVPWGGISGKPDVYPPDMTNIYGKSETYSKSEVNNIVSSYKLKGDFYVITGSADNSAQVDYPSGFTKDNCVVVNAMFQPQTDTSIWATGNNCVGSLSAQMGMNANVIRLTSSNIIIQMQPSAIAGTTSTVPVNSFNFKIVLMKI